MDTVQQLSNMISIPNIDKRTERSHIKASVIELLITFDANSACLEVFKMSTVIIYSAMSRG